MALYLAPHEIHPKEYIIQDDIFQDAKRTTSSHAGSAAYPCHDHRQSPEALWASNSSAVT